MTQAQAILADLEAGLLVTPLDALERHGCFRLAARVADLRKAGYPVVTGALRLANGKHVAAYRLGEAPTSPAR